MGIAQSPLSVLKTGYYIPEQDETNFFEHASYFRLMLDMNIEKRLSQSKTEFRYSMSASLSALIASLMASLFLCRSLAFSSEARYRSSISLSEHVPESAFRKAMPRKLLTYRPWPAGDRHAPSVSSPPPQVSFHQRTPTPPSDVYKRPSSRRTLPNHANPTP